MALDDRGQRLDHRLDSLAGRDQPEGRQHGTACRRRPAARSARVRIGAPCEHASALRAGRPEPCSPGTLPSIDEQSLRGLRHHDHELGLGGRAPKSTSSLMRRRLREHGVQRDDERLRELLDEREDVGAVGAAEDPVLVLEQDDVDIQPAQDPRRADVVASSRLSDRGDEAWPLRAGGVVDDRRPSRRGRSRRRRAALRARRPQRCRSRTRAAGTWRRSRCARLTAPFRRDSGAAPRRQRSRFPLSVADVVVMRRRRSPSTRPPSPIGATVLRRIRPETTEALHPSSSSTTWLERCRRFVRTSLPCEMNRRSITCMRPFAVTTVWTRIAPSS